MKILKKHAGELTNCEVLDFLRSRGASSSTTRVFSSVNPSEFQVYDYLVQGAACNQTREKINEFLNRCESFQLPKAEKLNIINIRPALPVEIFPIIEDCEHREIEVEELVNLIVEVLPPPPNNPTKDDEES